MMRRGGCVSRHRRARNNRTAPEPYLECNMDALMMATAMAAMERRLDMPRVKLMLIFLMFRIRVTRSRCLPVASSKLRAGLVPGYFGTRVLGYLPGVSPTPPLPGPHFPRNG